ncbi:hypothetical protein Ddc_09798 [Ditylenchus destructor]|nr:hypothetical protein Ddc_09798 [Ditylenchus destructor]
MACEKKYKPHVWLSRLSFGFPISKAGIDGHYGPCGKSTQLCIPRLHCMCGWVGVNEYWPNQGRILSESQWLRESLGTLYTGLRPENQRAAQAITGQKSSFGSVAG